MNEAFRAVQITDHVYWVGAIDWSIRDFHGYLTSRGSTYNAYLVLGEKNTLVDAVKAPLKEEMLSRIASVLAPEKIDYIISNHAEMDHSGALFEVADVVHPEKIYASSLGNKTLIEHFHTDREITMVKDGETCALGNLHFTFLESRMLHWPESMVTYLAEDRLLFSQDIFGMHLATGERFTDEIAEHILNSEAAKYYANIILPYSQVVLRFLDKVKDCNLEIEVIAPDHGPVWRKNPLHIISSYTKWAAQKPTKKAVIVYDTMWNSTALMADVLADGLMEGGAAVKQMPLGTSHRSDVATEILEAGALVVGSPTLNNNIFPTVADVMTYLKGLKPQNLCGAVFGSHGWSGEAIKQLEVLMKDMKVDLVADSIKAKYVPDQDVLKYCHAVGKQLAERLAAVADGDQDGIA